MRVEPPSAVLQVVPYDVRRLTRAGDLVRLRVGVGVGVMVRVGVRVRGWGQG